METFTLPRNEYDAFGKKFIEKTKPIEDKYKQRLEEEGIKLPLVSNFAWGENLNGKISGSPSDRLPEWVKELLRSAWNETLTDYFH